MLQVMREGCVYTYPVQCTVYNQVVIHIAEWTGATQSKKLAQGFNTAAQDSNLGPLNQESEALPLSHCSRGETLLCQSVRQLLGNYHKMNNT